MKIVIASDFSGFQLKEAVKNHLINIGYNVTDVGQQKQEDQMFYFDTASNLARAVQSGNYSHGIVICGTGAGVSMICLLYTSDAADEEDSVDLGGRRIITKKHKNLTTRCTG